MDPQEQALLDKAGRNGWTITGRTPDTESVSGRDENNNPVTTQRPTGNIIWTINDGKGHNQQMVVSAGVPNQNAGDIVKPPADIARTSEGATPATGLERLDANLQPVQPGQPAVYVRDPNAPAGTQPFRLDDTLGDPSTWTPIYEDPVHKTGRVIGLFDAKAGKVAASIAAPSGSKDSDPSKWTPVYRTPGDPKSGVVGQWDPSNNELHAVSATPDGKQIVQTDQGVYVVDKDTGKSTLIQAVDKTQALSVVTHPDGSIYLLDPNEKDRSKSLTKLQGSQPPQTLVQTTPGGNVTLVYDPESKSYKLPPGTSMPSTIDAPGAAALEYIVTRDANGNELTRTKNPNYRPPQTTQGAQSTTARQIQQWNAKTGQWEWVPNEGRIVASEALRNMATQLTGQVVAGDISEDEATKLITAANAKMANDIAQQQNARAAAGDILTSTAQGATTGAGLLNQRVSSATSALTSIMGNALGSKMQGLPTGVGQQLVGGLQNSVTGLGGGPEVYDTAARLVQAGDPKISGDPTMAQQATQALAQIFQQIHQQTGQPAPQVAATLAAQQTTQTGNVTAPATAAPVIQPTAVASGQVAPPAQVPGANYGATIAYTGGISPWLAQPAPSFVAPPMAA